MSGENLLIFLIALDEAELNPRKKKCTILFLKRSNIVIR